MTTESNQPLWCFSSRKSPGVEFTTSLTAQWEIAGENEFEDVTPEILDAAGLFSVWALWASVNFPRGLLPIYWSVRGESGLGSDPMPFQPAGIGPANREHFLALFTWPLHAVTLEPLIWLSLPVENKHWNRRRMERGGFIQEFTGWKPSILQPYVHLPALTAARSAG